MLKHVFHDILNFFSFARVPHQSWQPSSVELPLVEIPEWPQRKVVHRETPSGTTSRVLKILFTNETQNEISNPNIQAQAIYSTMNY